jgi:hypothetical protein
LGLVYPALVAASPWNAGSTQMDTTGKSDPVKGSTDLLEVVGRFTTNSMVSQYTRYTVHARLSSLKMELMVKYSFLLKLNAWWSRFPVQMPMSNQIQYSMR